MTTLDDKMFMEYIRAEHPRHVTESNFYCSRTTTGHIVEAWRRGEGEGLWYDVTEIERTREKLQELQNKLHDGYGDITLSANDKLNLGVRQHDTEE